MPAHAIAICFPRPRVVAIRESASKDDYLRFFQDGRLRDDVVEVDDVSGRSHRLECRFRLVLGVEPVA